MKLTVDVGAMDSRIQMLTAMEKDYEGFNKAVKLVCQAKGTLRGIHGPVAGLMKTEQQYSLAIEIALGAAMIFYQGSILVALVAVYLIVFPLVRVLLADQKAEQFKRELLRIVLGVVLLVFVPSLVGAAFTLVHLLLVIGGWIVIALSTIFGVIEIVRIATAKEIQAPQNGHIYVDFEEKQD